MQRFQIRRLSLNPKVYNKIYPKRGIPFSIQDYPLSVRELWDQKCRNVDEIIAGLPGNFSFATSFLGAQARGFLRALSKRQNFESIEFFASFFLEPYEFLQWPQSKYRTFYFGPVERLLNNTLKKTVHFVPKQYTQVDRAILHYAPQYYIHTATVPNEEGYVNLGLNNASDEPYLRECVRDPNRKVILEINSYTPWVPGSPDMGEHKVHLSEVDFVYENHEPLFQLPAMEPSDVEKRIAEYACKYIKDGSVIQFGIGGIPNYIATQITSLRDIGLHTEMLSDGVIDLIEKGVITNKHKELYPGISICGFIAGTDRLYDWVDRNPLVWILPICQVNDPRVVSKMKNFVSINAGLMIDFQGQVCSEAIGFNQYSGTGGQFEFVQGANLSPGGKSVICIKSSAMVKEKPVSNILSHLPPGASVTVPRFFTDTVITEHGVAEILHESKIERTNSLIKIANPLFRENLVEEAKKLSLWEATQGFDTISQKVLYKSIGRLSKIKKRLSLKYWISRLLK